MKCDRCGYDSITDDMNFCPQCGSNLLPDVVVPEEVREGIYDAIDGSKVFTLESLASAVSCDRLVVLTELRRIKQRCDLRSARCRVILGLEEKGSVTPVEEMTGKKRYSKGKKIESSQSWENEEMTFAQKKKIYAISLYCDAEFKGKTKKEASQFIDKYKHVLPPRD